MDDNPSIPTSHGLAPSTHYAIATIYAVLASSAFVLNSLVLLTFFLDRSLLTASNMFIVSITIADWLMAVIANPLGVVANALQAWPFGNSSCVFYGWITAFLGLSTMLHHSALAVERCRAVSVPFSRQSTRKQNLCIIGLLWSFTLIWSLCPVFGLSAYVPEGANTVCSIRWRPSNAQDAPFLVCIFIFFFFGPLAVVMVSYSLTYWTVRRMAQRARATWGTNAAPTLETISKAKCLAKIGLLMVTGFFVAWSPYAVVSMYTVFGNVSYVPALTTVIPAVFAKSASLYNPLIYFFLYKRFRVSMKKLQPKFTILIIQALAVVSFKSPF